jgi:proline iminopeptidase
MPKPCKFRIGLAFFTFEIAEYASHYPKKGVGNVTGGGFKPWASYKLARDGHVIHVERHGVEGGMPTVILHGGPGAGLSHRQLMTVDLNLQDVVLFDQRGGGQSEPNACIENNTTQHLVEDMEAIRSMLGFEKWIVAGGSWGSTLALAYAQAYPERVAAIRLYGIFLASPAEVDWWFKGLRTVFPDCWEDFAAHVSEDERDDLCSAYYKRLTSPDSAVSTSAAYALRLYSARTQTLEPSDQHTQSVLASPKLVLAVARLFTHYCVNGAFLAPNELLDGIDIIRGIPADIIQARYDMVTPMSAAWKLHRAWPEAGFSVVTLSNHTCTAPMIAALRQSMDNLLSLVRPPSGIARGTA